jgi:hypothetical protein
VVVGGVAGPEPVGGAVGVEVLAAEGDGAGVGEGDMEGDAVGEAGAVPDGDATGVSDATAGGDADAAGEADAEHCGAGRVWSGSPAASSDGPCAGEASVTATMPVTEAVPPAAAGLHCGRRVLPGDGEPFAVLLVPRELCPLPVSVPVPVGVPPPLFPPPLFPVSTVEPTCTIVCRSGETARPMHARNATPTRTTARLTVVPRKKCSCSASYPRRT